MRNVLYVVANLRLETVELVAKCLKQRYPEGFSEIVLFESSESEEMEYAQIMIYREYFGNFIKTVIPIEKDGSISVEKLYEAFNRDGRKVVDLSNGQKMTTSSLFLATSLCQMDETYCLILHNRPSPDMKEGKDYEYLTVQRMEDLEQLAKLSYFDFVYYRKILDNIYSDTIRSNGMETIYEGLNRGLVGFFNGMLSPSEIVYNVTIGTEVLIDRLLEYLQNNQKAKDFCIKYNNTPQERVNDIKEINLNFKGDKVGVASRFYKCYVKKGEDEELLCLSTLPGLLSALREYRNISAHYASNHAVLSSDTARTVINMQIEVLTRLHENPEIWGRI